MSSKLGVFRKCIVAAINISIVAFISGCSDESSNSHEDNKPVVEIKPEAMPQIPAEPTLADQGVTVLESPELPPHGVDYYLIANGMDLLYLFNANAPGVVDILKELDKISGITTNGLGDEQLTKLHAKYESGDQFEKRKIAKEIEPVLIKKITDVSGVRYLSVDVQSAISLGKYDFDRHGYVINNGVAEENGQDSPVPYNRSALSYNDAIRYKLSFLNTSNMNFIHMPDEDAAKKVNEYQKQNAVSFRVYGYLQSVAEDRSDSYNVRYVVIKAQKIEVASSIYDENPRQVFASIDL
jgi:hypothetical protein